MIELLRTNDLVLISLIEAILTDEAVRYFVADTYMSALEGSTGFLPRRIMIDPAASGRARRALIAAGLEAELPKEKGDAGG